MKKVSLILLLVILVSVALMAATPFKLLRVKLSISPVTWST